MNRLLIFIDFWNFQLNWNERTNRAKIDWQGIPKTVMGATRQIYAGIGMDTDFDLAGVRVYASVNPTVKADKGLQRFLEAMSTFPGFNVNVAHRTSRTKPIHCSSCGVELQCCSECGAPFRRAAEKGVDAAIITDMFSLHIEGVYNIAALASSDADMVPMVDYLQNRGVKVINLSWKKMGYKLKKTCWAAVDMDTIASQLTLL